MRDELEEMRADLFAFCRRLTGQADLADDLTQETLLRAMRNAETKPPISNIRAWLFRISVNVFREWLGKQQRQSRHLQQYASEQSVRTEAAPPEVAQQVERLAEVHAFIAFLPGNQRQALNMHLVEGLSHQEIAQRMNISVDSVKSTVCAAKRKLRTKYLQSSDDAI